MARRVAAARQNRTDPGAFRRHVLYIPGYDPFPPRRYRELYRTEGTEQAAISGYELRLRSRSGETYGWEVETRIEGREAVTQFEVLVWSDLVKQSMGRGIAGTYLLLARTAWVYIASGALRRLIRLRKGPMIAALYPVVLLILQALVAVLAATAVVWLLPWAGLDWALGAVTGAAVLAGFRRLDRRLYVYYLMHDFAFTAIDGGAYPPELEERLMQFRARLRAALDSEVNEVLVVGHSSGVHLGVSLLADELRAGVSASPALAFLSLGQAVPMASFLPGARRLRADLRYLSERTDVAWVDVTAPSDGCSFALCDPVAVTGVATPAQRWPLVISAAFTQTLSAERWAGLKRKFFRLHFQYMCAFDRPGDYDYFQITAGPISLRKRFRGRRPSANRITEVFSPHRDAA